MTLQAAIKYNLDESIQFITTQQMISLQDFLGLPLLLNNQDHTLQTAGEVNLEQVDRVKLDMIRPTLLNRTLKYPMYVYTEYMDVCLDKHASLFKKNKLHYNVLVLPPGLLGIEYNKTHIFSPDKDHNDITGIVDIVHGRGLVLVQKLKEKNELSFETEVDFVSMFVVKKGDRVAIPQKYMYTFINSSNSPFVIARLFEDDGKIDYRGIWREQGMSYYFIRKNARREVVRNPRYRVVPKLRKVKPDENIRTFKLTSSKPLYTQVTQNPERFKGMLV